MEHRSINISLLDGHKKNYNTHPPEQLVKLKASLERFEQVRSIVVALEETGRYTILAGHGVVEAAASCGIEELNCDIVPISWDEATRSAYLVADNLHSQDAIPDNQILAELLQEQQDLGFDLSSVGASDYYLDELLAGLEEDNLDSFEQEEEDDFEGTADEEQTRVKYGDLWQVGSHRLLVGDSANDDDVKKLLDGQQMQLVVTSPPYASQRKYDKKSDFTPIHPDKYEEWFTPIQALIAKNLAPDGSFFLNIKEHSEDKVRHLYVKDLTISLIRKHAWKLIDEFCWTHAGFPGVYINKFKNAWEPVYHYALSPDIKFRPLSVATVKNTAMRYNRDLRYEGVIEGERAFNMQPDNVDQEGLVRPSNVLNIATGGGKTTGEHPAEYPIGLPQFFIRAFTDEEDSVYDPFGGSGSTLMASEIENRNCYTMEISPKFAELILRRWETKTGGKAHLLGGQEMHDGQDERSIVDIPLIATEREI